MLVWANYIWNELCMLLCHNACHDRKSEEIQITFRLECFQIINKSENYMCMSSVGSRRFFIIIQMFKCRYSGFFINGRYFGIQKNQKYLKGLTYSIKILIRLHLLPIVSEVTCHLNCYLVHCTISL
jgi:hypothetical protein